MIKSVSLNTVAEYSKERIKSTDIDLDSFITTDNLLPDKQGVTRASNLPPQDCIMPAYKPGNILVGNIRPYLKKIWFAKKNGGCSADVLVFEAKKGYSPQYLYYALFRDDFFQHMMRGKKGTKMPRGDKNQIMDFLVPDFPPPAQERIAKVLSTLDSKIENCNRLSSVLDAVARTLYNYWFIQFDFPDKQGRPYKTSGGKMVYSSVLKREIPLGWEVKQVKDFLAVKTGKEDANFSTTNGQYPFFTCADEALRCDTAAFTGKAILLSGNGSFYVKYYSGEFNAYQRTYVLIPQDELYVGIIHRSVLETIRKFTTGSNGSIVKFIRKDDVEGINVLVPTDTSLLTTLNTLLTSVHQNNEQVRIISQLRDWLLPMLMNGQVTVK